MGKTTTGMGEKLSRCSDLFVKELINWPQSKGLSPGTIAMPPERNLHFHIEESSSAAIESTHRCHVLWLQGIY